MIEKIYQIEELSDLESYLKTFANQDELRENLFNEFLSYADYKNASDWNKAVRLCECLAIVGWGEKEPLQAIKGQFFNGSPMTYFKDKFSNRHFVDAIWSKRKLGVTMEMGRTSYFKSPNQNTTQATILWDYPTFENIQDIKLLTQRNWFEKAPIFICPYFESSYPNSDFLEDELVKLQYIIHQSMLPKNYCKIINYISFTLNLSYPSRKDKNGIILYPCHYVIFNSIDNRKQEERLLKSIYSDDEVHKNGYNAVTRFKYSNFMKKTGIAYIDLFLEKEFSDLSQNEQKAKLAEYFLIAIKTFAQKYHKKLNYPFDVMIADFEKVLQLWLNKV